MSATPVDSKGNIPKEEEETTTTTNSETVSENNSIDTHTNTSSSSSTNSSSSNTNPSSSNSNTFSIMTTNTLANLRAVISVFDTEESSDAQNMARKYTSWISNFEACIEFEGVTEARKKPAMLALGGEKLRELCTTLGITPEDDYAHKINKKSNMAATKIAVFGSDSDEEPM